jgi:cysteine desulfurase/selenocysteine lyase
VRKKWNLLVFVVITLLDAKKIRSDFPFFEKTKVIYFDNACMTLRPMQVIEAVTEYYEEFPGCAGRSAHRVARRTEEKTQNARESVASFVGAKSSQLVWTKNATEGLNLVCDSLDYSKRKTVVTTELEHHSLLLPLQRLHNEGKINLKVLKAEAGAVPFEAWEKAIDSTTRLVATNNANNTTGLKTDVKRLAKLAGDNGALTLIDGAQGVPHFKTDFSRDGIDFLAFSSHKMLGSGMGALVAREELLEELPPFMVGGGTIEEVKLWEAKFLKPPQKFEAGLQHYESIIGFGAAAEYLKKIGMDSVEEYEKMLRRELLSALLSVPKIEAYGPGESSGEKFGALASFNIKNAKPQEVGVMLDELAQVAVRTGAFCAHPAMQAYGAPQGAVRASLYIYNTPEEIRVFKEALEKIAGAY